VSAAARFSPNPVRRAMTAKLHLAKKELGLGDEDYRAILCRVTGKSSSADMTDAQMDAALAEFERLGWKAKPSAGRAISGSDLKAGRGASAARPADPDGRRIPSAADHPVARKATAMWISLYNLGAVRNPSNPALEAFAARQLGVAKLQWANQAHGYKLIEALKAMAERAGWDQTPPENATETSTLDLLMRRLVARQCAILQENGDSRSDREIVNAVLREPSRHWQFLPGFVLRHVSSSLGEQVRKALSG
jgi:phage gp16-like protein